MLEKILLMIEGTVNIKEKSLVVFCVVLLLIVSGCAVVPAESNSFKWIKTDHSVALANADIVVWQFNYNP